MCTVQTVRGHPCSPASRPRCLCMDRVFATRPEQTSSHCQPGQDNAWATLTLFPRVLIQNLNNNVSLARGHRPTLLTPPGTTRICFQGLNIVVQREIVVLQVHESSPVCGNLPHSAESERFVSVPSDHLHHQAWPSLRSKAATDTMQAISMPRGDQRETTLVCITSPPTSCPSFLSGHSMNCLHVERALVGARLLDSTKTWDHAGPLCILPCFNGCAGTK